MRERVGGGHKQQTNEQIFYICFAAKAEAKNKSKSKSIAKYLIWHSRGEVAESCGEGEEDERGGVGHCVQLLLRLAPGFHAGFALQHLRLRICILAYPKIVFACQLRLFISRYYF